tara:strand:- start:530 stop:997 length:468 start_codon:yes stop_codon:yes gene_type:complete
MSVDQKIKDLNIDLSKAPDAVGSYLAYKTINKLVYISGQLPIKSDGTIIKGKVGIDKDLKEAQNAAYLCGLNILGQLNKACNEDLNKVKNCVKITGYVNSTDNFYDQPKVINPVSELFVNIFGEIGKHARAAVSVNSLPLGASVEVDAIFQISLD